MSLRGLRWAASLLAAAGLSAGAAGAARAQMTYADGLASYNVPVSTFRDIPFRSVVRQQYDFSCGSAALATLLHYHYARPVTETDVFRAMWAEGDHKKIRQVGFSLMDMKRYLSAQGFNADGYRINVGMLAQLKTPAIAVIRVGNYKHFVVIKGARDGKVLVGDPALGLRSYTAEEFTQMWDGIVFVIRSGPTTQVVYNKAGDWSVWPEAPLGDNSLESSVSSATRNLPPLYQVLNTLDVNNPAARK
jgi:predicted double-glycine peptidase